MATVTGFTAARMKQIEDETVVSGLVDVNGDLLLYTREGAPINAGYVVGPPGSDATVGFATPAETVAGTAEDLAVSPYSLAALTATSSRRGLVEFATPAETIAGTAEDLAVTPEGLVAWAGDYSTKVVGAHACFPESVTLSSGGTATVQDDGRVVFSGVTNLTLDNVLEAEDGAWELDVSCTANSGGIYLQMQGLTSYNLIGQVSYWNAGPSRIQYFPTTVFSYIRFYSGSRETRYRSHTISFLE